MATNIEREEGLLKVIRNTHTRLYDVNKKDDILSDTEAWLTVVFKDKYGTYPDGKVDYREYVTKYKYDYTKDATGNIISCVVTETSNKTGESTDYEKTSTETTFNEKGQIIRIERKTRDGVTFNREQFWYYEDGTLKEKTIKGSHDIRIQFFNTYGKLILEVCETFKSKAHHRVYSATYNDLGELIHYTKYPQDYECKIEIDKDHEGNKLSETKIYRHLSDKKVFSKNVKIYDPMADYQLSKEFVNGFLKQSMVYDINGEVIEMFMKESNTEVMTRISRTVDPETQEKTVEKHIYTTDKDGHKHSKYIKFVYDKDKNLLLNSEDNSLVTTYTYNNEGKRATAITKQLIGEEFVVISKITYTYETEGEATIRIHTEERYDKDGNITSKQTFKETESDILKEKMFEERIYEIAC